MPKRTSKVKSSDPERERSEAQGTASETKSTPVLKRKPTESEEAENLRALDAAAGVEPSKDFGLPGRTLPEVTRPSNAAPLLKADTREKLLYKIACTGTPLGSDFFDQFPDVKEILELALSISVRLCVVAICNSEVPPTQRISAMRLVAALNGKELTPDDDETKNRPAPPFSIPTGADDAQKSIDRIRELQKAS